MEEALREQIVNYSLKIHQKGWVANHDGNLSVKITDSRFVCTPTAVSKGDVKPSMLIVVGSDGALIEGTRKPFSEFAIHRAAYSSRPEIKAVIHAHPPTATGFAVAGVELGAPFMAEPVVSLGASIPLIPYFLPGDKSELEAVSLALEKADVIIMSNHGVLAVGDSLEQCFLRIELVEHLAKIALVARQLGGVQPIPTAHVEKLVQKRIAAGLGPKGQPTSWAQSPTNSSSSAHQLVQDALKKFGR